MITHVVLMRLTDRGDTAKALELLTGLATQVPTCLSLRTGADVTHGPNSWHLGLVTTHDDLDGLAAYQAHPRHQDVIAWLGPRIAERAIVDF